MSDAHYTRGGTAGPTADVAARLAAITELQAELANTRFTGGAANGMVVVIVNGNGNVVETRIADALLRQGHPQAIGPAVLTALAQARTAVGEVTRRRLALIQHGTTRAQVAVERPSAPGQSRGRRPRSSADDEPDVFTGLRGGQR